jgi:hypothetical protein
MEEEIIYACGHSEMHVKSQRSAVNAIFVRNAARKVCKTCMAEHEARRKGMISNSIQRTKEAVADRKLTGTEKQIKWGDEIRENWLDNIKRQITPHYLQSIFEKTQSSGASPDAVERSKTNVLAVRLAAIDEMLTHGEAGWWIKSFKNQHLDLLISSRTDEAIKAEFTTMSNAIAVHTAQLELF